MSIRTSLYPSIPASLVNGPAFPAPDAGHLGPLQLVDLNVNALPYNPTPKTNFSGEAP